MDGLKTVHVVKRRVTISSSSGINISGRAGDVKGLRREDILSYLELFCEPQIGLLLYLAPPTHIGPFFQPMLMSPCTSMFPEPESYLEC